MNQQDENIGMHEQSAKIESIDNEPAVLSLHDQKISWPVGKLPKDIKEGDEVIISLSTSSDKEEERKKLAKELINEILED